MSEFQKIMEDLEITDEEIMQLAQMLDEGLVDLPKSLGFPEWTYKDLPRMTPEVKDDFVSMIGEENIQWITFADYDDGSVRGQVLLSPTAMAIIEKAATNPSVN